MNASESYVGGGLTIGSNTEESLPIDAKAESATQ